MQALVTGASGFVGANLVEELSRAGWSVRALLRDNSSLVGLKGLDYERVEGDVLDPQSLQRAMDGCDGVFHVAAVTADYWQQDLERLYRVNVDGTANVMEAAQAVGVARVVHTSTQVALGLPVGQTPMTEDDQLPLSPKVFPYAHSKYLAEQEVQAAVARGLDAVIVNPTTVFGPRDAYLQNSRIILEIKRGSVPWLPSGGINVVDVGDLARGHRLAFEKGRTGQRYLLGGHNGANHDLARLIATMLGVRAPGVLPSPLVRPLAWLLDGANRLAPRSLPISGDVLRMASRFTYVDIGKAVQELGYTVSPLEDAIQRAISWLREEGHL